MNVSAKRRNIAALIALGTLVVLSIVAYMTVELSFDNERLLRFAMKLRTPKLFAMLIAAFAIGGASIVFQSIINNTIVTPCLWG